MNTVSNSFTTFAAKIIAFFMMIAVALFPNVPSNIAFRQSIENSVSRFGPKLISAVESKNVEAMKALMCANIRNNVKDLDAEIQELYDAIHGEIEEMVYDATYNGGGYSMEQKERDGRQIVQSQYYFTIKTSTQNYILNIMWESVNTMNEDETQIRAIALAPDIKPLVYLKSIQATEGVGEWHE